MPAMKIIVRVYKKGKVIRRWMTQDRTKWRKLHAKLASAGGKKYYVRVEYSIQENAYGKKELFFNEGVYDNSKEAKQALSAFME